MTGRRVRSVLVTGVLAFLVARVVQALRGAPMPAPAGSPPSPSPRHPTVDGGLRSVDPLVEPTPSTTAAPTGPPEPSAPTGTTIDDGIDAIDTPPVVAAATAAEPPPASAAGVVAPIASADGAASGWAEPVDGECPDGFPVKGKVRSGIFHAPGQLAYDRTVPDRCYADPAAAEADGLRPAKR